VISANVKWRRIRTYGVYVQIEKGNSPCSFNVHHFALSTIIRIYMCCTPLWLLLFPERSFFLTGFPIILFSEIFKVMYSLVIGDVSLHFAVNSIHFGYTAPFSCNIFCLLTAYPWTSALNSNLVHWLYLTDVKLPPDPKLLFCK